MMIRKSIIYLLMLMPVWAFSQSGKFAGTMKGLVGLSYADSRKISALKSWQYREGTLVTPVNDPQQIVVDVFQKGTTYVVFFSINDDTSKNIFVIADVLEIKNVGKGWQIKTATCSDYGQNDMELVALAKETSAEKIKTIKKAWRFNRDKIRFESWPIKNMECINEGQD